MTKTFAKLTTTLTLFGTMLVANLSFAADECGLAVAGGTITCDGDGTPITDTNPYTNGINYTVNGLTLNVNAAATDITTNAKKAIFLTGTGTNDITINTANTLSITTDGGIHADAIVNKQLGTGAVIINSSATILAKGNDGEGILGWVANAANSSTISIDATGTIETQGINAAGIMGYTIGSGAVDITTTADVTSAQTFSDTVLGWINESNNASAITIIAPSGQLTTSGTFSPGIQAYHVGLGSIAITSSASINTSASGAHGILANTVNVANAQPVSVTMNGGSITTTDVASDGIYADIVGTGVLDINVNAGVISTTGTSIHTMAQNGGVLSLQTGVNVTNINGNIAIRDGDRDNDGVDEVNGGVVINSSANITGNVILGLGNDVLNLDGGSIMGDIFTDDRFAVMADGDDTFNWSAGAFDGRFNSGNGSDTVTISTNALYDGNEVLNGGDDNDLADTWTDTLTFNSVIATVNQSTLLNWENIIVNAGEMKFLTAITVGNEATTGLTVENEAILSATDSWTLTGNLNNNAVINAEDNDALDTLTINGNYNTIKAEINIDSVLGDSSSLSDKLIISGDTSGTTTININNLAGSGATTTGNGILVVQVGGNSNGVFELNAPIKINGYQYDLVKVANDWYLQGVAVDIDVAINKEIISSAPYFLSDTVTYRLTISNAGPAVATNIVVNDTLTNLNLEVFNATTCAPMSFPCTIPTLGVGENETIIVIASFIGAGDFDNTASLTVAQFDTDLSNNSDTTANNGTVFDPDIAITINNCVAPLSPSQDLVYEITISNEGDFDLTNVNYASQLSSLLTINDWSCMEFNGASCPAATGVGDINDTADFPIGSSLTYLINAQVNGGIGNFINSSAQVFLPFNISESQSLNNFAQDIDTILDLIFANGFDCKAAGN